MPTSNINEILQMLAHNESVSGYTYTWPPALPPMPWQAVATPTAHVEGPPTPSIEILPYSPYYDEDNETLEEDEDVPEPEVDIKVGDVWKHRDGTYLAKILEDRGEGVIRVDIYRVDDHTDFLQINAGRTKGSINRFWTLLSRAPKKHLRHYFEGVEDVGK